MATLKEKRKYVTDYLTRMYNDLDPTGANTKNFMQTWGKMSDEEFGRKWGEYINDPERKGFYLEIVEFERDLQLDDVIKCGKDLNIPLFEYVAEPHLNGDSDEDIVVTPEPVPVGYIHAKRLQQTLLKKNTGSMHIEERNAKTGQVSGDDRNATTSNVETYSMTVTNSTNAIRELLGPRADNMVQKNEMYNAINRDGFVSLDELPNRQEDKIALNTLDEYFMLMGFRTNLVYPPEVIPNGDM